MNYTFFTSATFLMLALAPFTLFADSVSAVPAQAAQEAPKEKLVLQRADCRFDRVFFHFSHSITKETFDKSISITPEIKFETRQEYGSYFSVSGDFKPGETYAVRIAGSLAGIRTLPLGQNETVAFIAPDRSPGLDFLSDGKLFPLAAPDFSLPIQACNTGKIKVTTRQAYADCAASFFFLPFDNDFSKEIFSGEANPKARRNQYERYAVDLEKIGIPRKPGIYSVEIEDKASRASYYWVRRERTRTVIITDLAIQAAQNGEELAVAVKNISENTGVPEAEIELYSYKKRLIATARCDADGFVKLTIPALDDAEDSPAFILAKKGDDRSFLKLNDLSASRQSRGFEKVGSKAHVFPERGICRPGEEIHLFASLRDENKRADGNVPAEFHVVAPGGDSLVRIPVVGDAFGFYKASVKIPEFAATGTYRASLRIPGQEETAFGSTRFSVGEFVPDSLEVSVSTKHEADRIVARGNAAYYFGLPLDGGKVSFALNLQCKRFLPKGDEFKDFSFGFLPTINFHKEETAEETDAKGNFETAFVLPNFDAYPAPIVANVVASASSNAGGRSVSVSDSTEIHPVKFYLGTREKSADKGERVFDVCTLAPDASRYSLAGTKLKATLTRKEWNYVIREINGKASAQWQEEGVPAGEVEFDGGAESISVPVPACGNYMLTIAYANGTKSVLHEREFWHYYGETGTRSRNPAQLSFRLDREKYLPGETAKISFDSPFAGNAVLLAGSEKIETMQHVAIRVGENTLEIPIPEGILSGSRFFSVTASGKTAAGSPELVQRTFGVGVLPVNQESRKIFVKTEVPAVTRPGEKASVRVSLSDASGNPVAGKVQLWAVDRGVLSLTGFKTPDTFSYFFGTYACPYAFGDNYDAFYPLLALDQKLFGGGAGGASLRKFLDSSDQSKKSAVVVLETLDVPASGKVSAEITPPDFDGGMRLMAFALNEEKTGKGESDFIVREPVSAQMTAPRAVAPGDSFEIIAEIFNTDLPEQNFFWELSFDGKKISAFSHLKKGEKFVARENVAAGNDCGAQNAELRVFDGDGNLCSQESVSISIRTPFPRRDVVTISEIAPGGEAHFDNADPFGEVALGSPAIAVSGALDWLEDYPYGCLEQVSAATFPFLSAKILASRGIVPAEFADSSATKIRSGLSRISTMRRYDGTYSMWANGHDTWDAGTLFAYHLELEADADGFPITEEHREKMRRFLMKIADSKKEHFAQRAYATYLLALSGERRAVSFAKLFSIENNGDAFSQFLIGAAFIEAGYASEGMKMILPLLEKNFWTESKSQWANCLDSKIRRAGFILHVLSKIAPDAPANKKIALYLQNEIRNDGHWGSTQKNAWAAYGLASYIGSYEPGIERAQIKIGGEASELKGAMQIPGGKSVSVKNVGELPICCFVRSREKPKAFKPVSDGFEIAREYLDASGKPVTSCKTGDLLTVKIRVRAKEYFESTVICDLLPGGLEIEDETLMTRARTAAPKKNNDGGFCELVRERRFDRFLAFGSFYETDEWTELTYRVRAAARGKFAIPPVQIESMYDGEKRAAWAPQVGVFEVK